MLAAEVAAALDYAHRHGVIHRDIKPENIPLHDGRAMVADVGIALAAGKAGGTRGAASLAPTFQGRYCPLLRPSPMGPWPDPLIRRSGSPAAAPFPEPLLTVPAVPAARQEVMIVEHCPANRMIPVTS